MAPGESQAGSRKGEESALELDLGAANPQKPGVLWRVQKKVEGQFVFGLHDASQWSIL